MKKIFKFFVVAFAGLSIASCDNAFDVTSPSVVDETFVFSDFSTGKTVILGAYNQYIQANTNSEGFFCNINGYRSKIDLINLALGKINATKEEFFAIDKKLRTLSINEYLSEMKKAIVKQMSRH